MRRLVSTIFLLLLATNVYAGGSFSGIGGGGSVGTPTGVDTLDEAFDGGRRIDGAVSPGTAVQLGGTTRAWFLYQDGTGALRVRACDIDGTNCSTSGVTMETGSDWTMVNENGTACITVDSVTGALTFSTSGTCAAVITTPNLVLEDGNGAAPTVDGRLKFDRTAERLQVGNGSTTEEFVPVGTLTDTKYCMWDATGKEMDCNAEGGASSLDTYVIWFGCQDVNTTDGTTYSQVRDASDGSCAANETNANLKAHITVPWDGSVSGLMCEVQTAPGATEDVTFTVRFSSIDTNASVVISGTSQGPSTDTTADTAYTAGERITISVTTSSGSADIGINNCTVTMQRS